MNRPTLLCVDGDARFGAAYEILLGCAGYDVLLARNGRHAGDLLQNTRIDVAVVNGELSDTTGNAVAASIKTSMPQVAVIMVSDRPSVLEDARNFVDAALPRGAFEHLLNEVEALVGTARTARPAAAAAAA